MPDMTPDQPDKQQGMEDLAQKFAPGEATSVEGHKPFKEKYGKTPETTQLIPERYQSVIKDIMQKDRTTRSVCPDRGSQASCRTEILLAWDV